MTTFLVYAFIILLFLVGLGLALANLPGVWLVYLGIFAYALFTGFDQVSGSQLLGLALVSIAITLVDNIVVPLGAKKYGSSTWGMAGAIVGGLLGVLLGGPIGMLAGPLLGATLFEVAFARKALETALRAGVGATIGFLASVVLKFGATVWMTIWAVGKMF